VRSIYARYADDIEPFGMDEAWISLRGCGSVRKGGMEVAEEIRQIVKDELGLTVSIGVSFSKIFSKLGSDIRKPDAITVLHEDNWRERIWPLPVSELLFVGPATTRKLAQWCVHTIGELAQLDPESLRSRFGKNGVILWLLPMDWIMPGSALQISWRRSSL
jgi:DNA polymerase-4